MRDINETTALLSAAATGVLVALIVAALYFGAEVLVPLALAILLSFVLAPAVQALQKRRFPRSLSVISVVLLAFAVIFLLGSVIATQVTQLAAELPRYQSTMRDKIHSLRGATGTTGTLERAADVLQSLGKELQQPTSQATLPGGPTVDDKRPIPVEIHQPAPTALSEITSLIAPLVHPLTTTGLIIIFVIFILLQREDLRNRLIRLAGTGDLHAPPPLSTTPLAASAASS